MATLPTKWSFDPVETCLTAVADIHGEPVIICTFEENVVRDIGRIQSYIVELNEKGARKDESENEQRAVSIVS